MAIELSYVGGSEPVRYDRFIALTLILRIPRHYPNDMNAPVQPQPATRTESPSVNDVVPQPILDADLGFPTTAKRIPTLAWLLKLRLRIYMI